MKKEKKPSRTIKSAVKERPITLTQEDLVLANSIVDVLESGVKGVKLVMDHMGRVTVDPECYKSVACRCVRVKKISDGGDTGSKTVAKVQILCSQWVFPCPDYKYETIKRNLEHAICSILHIREVEVESFTTDIMEY